MWAHAPTCLLRKYLEEARVAPGRPTPACRNLLAWPPGPPRSFLWPRPAEGPISDAWLSGPGQTHPPPSLSPGPHALSPRSLPRSKCLSP